MAETVQAVRGTLNEHRRPGKLGGADRQGGRARSAQKAAAIVADFPGRFTCVHL